MGKFSPVGPPEYLHQLKDVGLLGDYHLILAHDVVAQPHKYDDLFGNDDFIIMDNSLIELGNPVDGATMARACNIVDVDCVVLPDHLADAPKTKVSVIQGAQEYMDHGVHNLTRNGFMVVPQGNTCDVWAECFSFMLDLKATHDVPINYWSIPKIYGEMFGSRGPALELMDRYIESKCIHLLGFSNNFADDIACTMSPKVMGIDSAVPIREGMAGNEMSLTSSNHTPRGDYFERAAVATSVDPTVVYNLTFIRELLNPTGGYHIAGVEE